MNIINIMLKELKINIRDRKGMTMMVLFPIILMTVLGTALSNAFDDKSISLDTKVIVSRAEQGNLSGAFKGFEQGLKDLGITFEDTNSFNEGIEGVRNVKYSAYIKVDEENHKIEIYKNDRYNFEANLVENALSTFVQRYNVILEVSKVNPMVLSKINNNSTMDIVKTVSIDRKRQPRAKDYYAISMLTLIIMYSSMTASFSITGEKTRNTGNRMLTTPVKKTEVFIGKVLGSLLITMLQITVVIFYSKYIFKTYWGDNMPQILLAISAEILMAVSLGIGIAYIVNNENTARPILNSIIPVIVFLGGGYVPLDQFNNKALSSLSKISPITWINDGIFSSIYNNKFDLLYKAVIINLVIALVFIAISSLKFRKEVV